MVLTSWEIGTKWTLTSWAAWWENDDDDNHEVDDDVDVGDEDDDENADDNADDDADDDDRDDDDAKNDDGDDDDDDDDNDADVLEKFIPWWRNPEAHTVNGHGDVKWWVSEQWSLFFFNTWLLPSRLSSLTQFINEEGAWNTLSLTCR